MKKKIKVKGRYKKQLRSLMIWEDKQRTFWFWLGLISGGVLGFYYASLYFLAKMNG